MEQPESRSLRFAASLRPASIRGKILLLALLATLIPALSTAALTYARTRAALTQTLQGELRGNGAQTAREVDLWVKERIYDLGVFVGSFEVIENVERARRGGPGATEAMGRLSDYLTVVKDPFTEYAALAALDQEGRGVAEADGEIAAPELPEGWLDDLRIGEARAGEPRWNEEMGAFASTMAVPIQASDGRFLGALVATVSVRPLREALEELAPGDRGSVKVLVGDGRIIGGTRDGPDAQEALPADALRALEASAGTAEYRSPSGTLMVGTLVPVPSLGWMVLTELPAAEAYAPVTRLTRSTFLLVALLLLVVGSAAYAIGLVITRPLSRLTQAAGAVAEGDLSVDIPVTGRDEVSYLTRVFNQMVARLRANAEALDEANQLLRAQNEELEVLSMTDALTSLFNRRYVMGRMRKELKRAARHDRGMAVLMMDLDRFKEYNDTYGHQAGDHVLAGMGEVLRDATRENDVPARYGGEEFIVMLPDCDISGAVDAGERIRARLSDEVFEGGKVTVSIGAAAFPDHGDEITELIAAADRALYAAKDAGRDRVVPADPDA